MFTITDIVNDISSSCLAHNMIEDKFSYRIIFFVNDGASGTKRYIDTTYRNLRKTLENIIRDNLSLTNSVVIAAVTVRKNGKCVYLQRRSYTFSLNEFFRRINGEPKNGNIIGERRRVNW